MTAPRTARRINDARERVVAATWELLADRSWPELTVADICARADVAPRTFHRYFVDKTELLFSDSPQHEEELAASLERHALDPASPRAFLEAAIADVAGWVEQYPHADVARRLELLADTPELEARDLLKRARLQAITAAALTRRLPAGEELRARVLAGVALTAAWAGIQDWAHHGGRLVAHMQRALDAADLGGPAG